MQSTPSEAGRAASRAESGTHTRPDSAGANLHDTVLPAREPVPANAPAPSPTLVLRPRILWRLPGPVLLLVAGGLAASGTLPGLVLVPVALAFLPGVWRRIDVSEVSIRRRKWNGRRTVVPMESVDTLRLRRLPFRAIRFLGRGFRIGRFWSVPLTLELQSDEAVRLRLRCLYWRNWRGMVRFVASQPGINLDEHSRGRLERYVGPLAAGTSVHL